MKALDVRTGLDGWIPKRRVDDTDDKLFIIA
jgi:hypothetical protein